MRDYVVAIELATGDAIAAWPGEAYRAYDEQAFFQYRVAATCTERAIDLAKSLHNA